MGQHYKQLCLTERIEIYRLDLAGLSLRAIGSTLGRSPSTISRELHRNSKPTKVWPGGYRPDRADALALRRRRWDARYKLARQPVLRAWVRDLLAMGWSPEQIAGRLTLIDAPMRISHESIYRYVYHRTQQKDYWNRLLPQHKGRRGRIRRGGRSSVEHIKHRLSMEHRPQVANDRSQPGHWEADLMLFSTYGQNVLVAHERHSRLVLAAKPNDRKAPRIAASLSAMLGPFPDSLRQTITFDNGTEFAHHYVLGQNIGIKTFFCDPYAPWQKGGVENAILRLRRKLPRKTDLNTITTTALDRIIAQYNNTPRKCLGYKTPAEVFLQNSKLLHFNRESICPLLRE